MLQLPEFLVCCWNLCDLIAGKVETDERQVSQLCKYGQKDFKNPIWPFCCVAGLDLIDAVQHPVSHLCEAFLSH